MALEIPESRICIICRKNHDLINVPVTIVNNKILFDSCLQIFEIEEETYNQKYKWKWDAMLDLPNFCTTCGKKIKILSECKNDLNSIKRKVDNIIQHCKLEILKSTPADKLNCSKRLQTSRTNAVDVFRSAAIQDWTPTIFISGSDQQACEVIELSNNEQLTLTNDEWNQYLEDLGCKFQCKLCSKIIVEKRNATRHINAIHKKIKRFQCSYCGKKFYNRSQCVRHLNIDHKNRSRRRTSVRRRSTHFRKISSGGTVNCVQDEPQCLVCLKSLEETGLPITSSVFETFCSAIGITQSKAVPYMLQKLQEFPLMCKSCNSRTLELHDLQEILKIRHTEEIIYEMKIKTEILLSLPTSRQITEDFRLTSNEVTAADKSEYFRKLIVQDYLPVVVIDHMQKIYPSKRTGGRIRQIQNFKTASKNSIFKYLNEDEVSVISEDLLDTIIPLSAEELEHYFICDDGKYSCRLCNSQSTTYNSAVHHCNKKHKNIKRYQCKYCGQQFYQRSDCGHHVLTNHKEERVDLANEIQKRVQQEERCKSKYEDGVIKLNFIKSDLKFIKKCIQKVGKGKYACTLCSMEAKHRDSVRIHLKIVHFRNVRFKCEFCDYKNHHRFQVASHVRKVHPEGLLNYSPPMQPPRKRSRVEPPSFMEGVIKLQVKEYPKVEDHFTGSGSDFTCSFCGRKFYLRLRVIQHVESVHFAVRNYLCATCGKKCYSLSSCRTHIKKMHLNNLQGFNKEIHNSVGIDPEENHFTPELEKTPQGPVKKEPREEIYQESCPVPIQKHLSLNSVQEHDFENGEEIPIRIPIKAKLEINVLPYQEIDEDQFLVENGIELDDVTPKTNKCTELLCQNEEPQSTPPTIIYTKAEGEKETEEMYSDNSTETGEKLDSEKIPANKAEIYNLIKPGEMIELPKNPNLRKNLEKGRKKLPNGYKCLKCHKVLKSKNCFRQHWVMSHDHLGGFQCSVCKQRFFFRWRCALHFVTKHTKRNPYVCPLCEKVFVYKGTLEKHIQCHTGERPFACTICNVRFTIEKTLKTHYEGVHSILGT